MKYPKCILSNILNPGMYVVVTTDKEHVMEVKNLEEKMTVEMLDDDTSDIDLKINMCVAVFFDGSLARGVIEKQLASNLFEVMLMDYGQSINVKKSAIKVITNEEYINVEPLAFNVRLYGLIPAKYVFRHHIKLPKAIKEWAPESWAFVRNLFKENERIVVQSILIQQRTVFGDLFIQDPVKLKYISVRKLLCKNEFCAYSESAFLRIEGLNVIDESVEKVTKMEMVKKWQEENFGNFKKNTYELPTSAGSSKSVASDVSTLNVSSAKSPEPEIEKQYHLPESAEEEISTSSFGEFRQIGMGRGRLRLLIEEMRIKEQASASSEQRSESVKKEELPKSGRGRGHFLKKYLYSKKETPGDISTVPGQTRESGSEKDADKFSEARGGEIIQGKIYSKSGERARVFKAEKTEVASEELAEFSESQGSGGEGVSIAEDDSVPPPLVGNIVKRKNLNEEKRYCEYETVNCEKLNKLSKAAQPEDEKREEKFDLDCSNLNETGEKWCTVRKGNVFESWAESKSCSIHAKSCWAPFVIFDDTAVESVDTFKELPIQPSIIQNLEKGGSFKSLSQVQRWAIPAIRKQHNTLIIGSAKTGKSLSYLVPLLDYVQDEFYFDELPRGNGPSVVILASSSRVCESIYYVSLSLLGSKGTENQQNDDRSKVKVVLAHGGGCEKEIYVTLTNGCDILISTPYCLVRLLEHPVLTNFERLTCLVLDEVDVIAQNPFKKNVRIILERAQLSTNGRHYQKIFCGEKWTPHVERIMKTYVKSYALVTGSYQEAVIHERLKPSLCLVSKERKAEMLLEKLKEVENQLKVVIFCETSNEVISLKEFLSQKGIKSIIVAHEKMLAEKLKEVEKTWQHSKESILLMTDGVINEICIREAKTLIHYDLPSKSKTNFFLRYSTVLHFYGKKWNFRKDSDRNRSARILIFVDDENHYQLPHIVKFVTRLGGELPKKILDKCEDIERVIEVGKLNSPICDNLLSFGRCRSSRECPKRHAMVKTRDSHEGLPTNGWISFAVVKTLNACLFSAILLEHSDVDGNKTKFEDSRLETQKKVEEFFKTEDKNRPHGVPQIGDVVGVKTKVLNEEVFYRAKVIEYLKLDKYENPLEVNVKLLDEGDIYSRKIVELYELSEELKKLPPSVIDIRAVGVQPLDFDVSWSQVANFFVKEIMSQKLEPNQFWSGKIVLALRDTLFLDPIKRKEFLPQLNVDVFDLVFNSELLNKKIAVTNNEHLQPLLQLCKEAEIEVPKKEDQKTEDSANIQPQWAFFDSDFVKVKFCAAENISTIFLQLEKYEKLLETLEEDIQMEVTKMKNEKKISKGKKSTSLNETITVGMFCLARFEDGIWNRARIETERELQFEVFFIDHGDFFFVPKEDVLPIPQSLLLRLPCQVIECRLLGVEDEEYPLEVLEEIYVFSEDGKETLFARVESKDPKGMVTNGRKYNVSLFNKRGISLSKMLVDGDLVRAKETEKCYLENMEIELSEEEEEVEVEVEEEENEDEVEEGDTADDEEKEQIENNNEKEVEILKPEAANAKSVENYLNNLKDDVFENEDALEFFREFASNLFPKIDGFEEVLTTSQEENIFKKAIEIGAQESDNSEPKNPEKVTETNEDDSNMNWLLELQKKRQSRKKSNWELKSQTGILTPQVLWCQNPGEIRLKILLGCVSDYSCEVTHNNISFRCVQGEKFYAMDVRLYGAVNPEMTKVALKAFHVSIILTKLASPEWPRLHLDEGKLRWISLDVEGLKDEQDELMIRIKTAKKEIEEGNIKTGIRSDNIETYSDYDSEDGGGSADEDYSDDEM